MVMFSLGIVNNLFLRFCYFILFRC